MPAQETQQPQAQAQQMELPTMENGTTVTTQQPRPADQMTAEPVSMRGGGGGGLCCGLCAGLACFECLECCC